VVQDTVALRNFDPADDRCGSEAAEMIETMRCFMSAMPRKRTHRLVHSRRQLFANAVIAASRVAATAYPYLFAGRRPAGVERGHHRASTGLPFPKFFGI